MTLLMSAYELFFTIEIFNYGKHGRLTPVAKQKLQIHQYYILKGECCQGHIFMILLQGRQGIQCIPGRN